MGVLRRRYHCAVQVRQVLAGETKVHLLETYLAFFGKCQFQSSKKSPFDSFIFRFAIGSLRRVGRSQGSLFPYTAAQSQGERLPGGNARQAEPIVGSICGQAYDDLDGEIPVPFGYVLIVQLSSRPPLRLGMIVVGGR